MIMDTLRTHLAGYRSGAGTPFCPFADESSELYPEAIVICTTRNPKRWHERVKEVMNTVNLIAFLDISFLPIPTLRHFSAWLKALANR